VDFVADFRSRVRYSMMPEEQQSTAVGIKRRACVNCTTGKAKCSPWSDSVCDRCHRLEKDCVYLKVVSKRKSPKSNTYEHNF
jgi:hypothetical protein